jgi:uncharacterized membrane protein YfcA
MKKKRNKKESKEDKKLNNFIAFGSRKIVFWAITLTTTIFTLIGIPLLIYVKTIINSCLIEGFIVLWLFEIVYIWMYLDKKGRKKKENEIKRFLRGKRR